MHEVVEPELFLIAAPEIRIDGMDSYLKKVEGASWLTRVITNKAPAAQALIEFAGRLCYRSWEPGLNKNVTKVREHHQDYLRNILNSGHGSVLEHASFSFAIHNCSRVLTAELNRHRAGIAISEQSLRYVRLDDLSFRLPPTLSQTSQNMMGRAVEELEDIIATIIAREITDDMPFHEKKEKTSAIRRLAPMGLATEMVWTANVRALRWIIQVRSAAGAEEEIRIFADKLAQICVREAPYLFGDFERNPQGEWITPYGKV